MRLFSLLVAALAISCSAHAQFAPSSPLLAPSATYEGLQLAHNGPGSIVDHRGLRVVPELSWASPETSARGSSFYIPCCRDPLSTTGKATAASPHDLVWYQNNHPDWLVYQSATKTSPATGGNGNLYALDIANADVQEYLLRYARDPRALGGLKRGVLAGYKYLAVDNVAAFNASRIQGYYAGAVPKCGEAPSFCGTWTQKYSGSPIDPVWAADVLRWVRLLRANMNSIGVGLWLNAKLHIRDVAGSIELASEADVLLRESQFLHACEKGNTDFVSGLTRGTNWYATLEMMNELHDKKVIVSFNYLCNKPVAAASTAEISYALANFYLMRGLHTYFEMQNGTRSQGAGSSAYPASMFLNLGAPLDPPPAAGSPNSSGGCYQRRYTHGLVVVWPSPTGSCSYTVPGGADWADMFGNPVAAGVHELQPDESVSPARANAIVLRRAS